MIAFFIAVISMQQDQVAIPSQLLTKWGEETLDHIRAEYYIPKTHLYAEEAAPGATAAGPSAAWGVGVLLSALNAASQVDPKYKPWLVEFADATRVYWNSAGPVPGYDVLPAPKDVDRYYDDNAWLALALDDTYRITGDKKYLDWATDTLKYVMSGEDRLHNSGIFWRESDQAGKGTCSNAPAVAANMALYQDTHNSRLLVDAIRIYGWTKRTLQDPKDHLFWDSISNEGKIGETKWSYNTGLMIRSAAMLYSATHNKMYLNDLIAMQTASAKHWLTKSLNDEGRFAHLLMESWIFQRDLAPVPNPAQSQSDLTSLFTPLAFLHTEGMNKEGFYGKRFDHGPAADAKSYPLIDQASAARAYFMAALYYKKVGA